MKPAGLVTLDGFWKVFFLALGFFLAGAQVQGGVIPKYAVNEIRTMKNYVRFISQPGRYKKSDLKTKIKGQLVQ